MGPGLKTFAAAGAGAIVMLGGCRQMAIQPARESLGEETSGMRVSLPDWWRDEPAEADGLVMVCALAESEDLLLARRQALEEAGRVFKAATGTFPGETAILTDSVRLRDGRFRAYVRLTGERAPGTE